MRLVRKYILLILIPKIQQINLLYTKLFIQITINKKKKKSSHYLIEYCLYNECIKFSLEIIYLHFDHVPFHSS